MENDFEILMNGHAGMLHDKQRHKAYKSAIKNAIEKIHGSGKQVTLLDIGAGTGLLTMFAAEAGADYIVACESDKTMAKIGNKIVSLNREKYKKACNIKFETITSTLLDKINPSYKKYFNIIVSEIYDSDLIGEGCLETYKHALNNLAAYDSIFIPAQATLFAQSVCSPILSNYSFVKEISDRKLEQFYLNLQKPWEIHVDKINDLQLGEIVQVYHLDFNCDSVKYWTVKQSVVVSNNKMSHGLLVWWRSYIDESNFITTAPMSNVDYQGFREHWMPLFYPLCPQSNDFSIDVEVSDMQVHFSHSIDQICCCRGNHPKHIELSLHRYIGIINCSELSNAYMNSISKIYDARIIDNNNDFTKLMYIGPKSFLVYTILNLDIRKNIEEIRTSEVCNIKDCVIIDSCFHTQCLTAVSHYYRRQQIERSLGANCTLIPNKVVLLVSLVECYQLHEKTIVPNEIDGFDVSHYSDQVKECLRSCRGEDMFEPIHLWEYDYVMLSQPLQFQPFQTPDGTFRKILPVQKCGTVTNIILSLAFYFHEEYLEFNETDYFNKVDCYTCLECMKVKSGDEVCFELTLKNDKIESIDLIRL